MLGNWGLALNNGIRRFNWGSNFSNGGDLNWGRSRSSGFNNWFLDRSFSFLSSSLGLLCDRSNNNGSGDLSSSSGFICRCFDILCFIGSCNLYYM